jgi:hypothetical protein
MMKNLNDLVWRDQWHKFVWAILLEGCDPGGSMCDRFCLPVVVVQETWFWSVLVFSPLLPVLVSRWLLIT